MWLLLQYLGLNPVFQIQMKNAVKSLREKCPNTEFFLVCIFPIEILHISPYSVRMQRKIRARKSSVFGHFSRSQMSQR